ncbi:tripartite tricarboxylate transporter TctB family protein [uncultured Jannaschia sp.]|uniref:tripartite tricarboxylate transporter TctB family protein n=1 Tax=uncultured Jannaschia sp. TaxID=293347 RepID=UPI00261C122F|nr:tripartite tricarboxylate transporter TctB family protein [uncultured Jannaschia sp.]
MSSILYDLVVYAALGGVGLVFFVGAFGLSQDDDAIDSGTVPMIAGGLLVLLCAIGAVQAVRTGGTAPEVEVERPFPVLIAMVMVVLFPIAMDALGYYATAAIWVPAFAWIAGSRSWVAVLLVPVGVLALARFVFEMILGTPLP